MVWHIGETTAAGKHLGRDWQVAVELGYLARSETAGSTPAGERPVPRTAAAAGGRLGQSRSRCSPGKEGPAGEDCADQTRGKKETIGFLWDMFTNLDTERFVH